MAAAAAYFLSTRAVSQPARCVTRISATSPHFGPKAVSPTDMCAFLRVFRSIFIFFCQSLYLSILLNLLSLCGLLHLTFKCDWTAAPGKLDAYDGC